MKQKDQIKNILISVFKPKHIDAVLEHFSAAIKKYQEIDWEGSIARAAKFVEAVTKALLIYCGQSVPTSRKFRAGPLLRNLEKLNTKYDDVVCIAIPKCCIFIYEIANNRGARHDPDKIDANEMDANVIISCIKWILTEMIRFTSKGSTPKDALTLIEELTRKTYPEFESIDGRDYINIDRLSADKIALLLLYYRYPYRISRQELFDLVKRHDCTKIVSNVAVTRAKRFVDEGIDGWKLRGLGRQKAESILANLHKK